MKASCLKTLAFLAALGLLICAAGCNAIIIHRNPSVETSETGDQKQTSEEVTTI